MYFRDLAIWDDKLPWPNQQARWEIGPVVQQVVEVFLSFMPRRYVLDGTAKTNINLGPIPDGTKQYAGGRNISIYWKPDVTCAALLAGDLCARQEFVLSIIVESLEDLARRFHADPEPIRAAAKACSFEREVDIQTLSRSTPDRRHRLQVFQKISAEGVTWGIHVLDRRRQCIGTVWMCNAPLALKDRWNYRTSRWKGNSFQILDRVGRISFKLAVQQIELMRAKAALQNETLVKKTNRVVRTPR